MSNLYFVSLAMGYDREKISLLFDNDYRIKDWFYYLPQTIFLKTNLNAKEISELVSSSFGQQQIFVTQVHPDYWGHLPKTAWEKFPPCRNA